MQNRSRSAAACQCAFAAQEGDDLVHTNTLFPGESVGDLDVLDGAPQPLRPASDPVRLLGRDARLSHADRVLNHSGHALLHTRKTAAVATA